MVHRQKTTVLLRASFHGQFLLFACSSPDSDAKSETTDDGDTGAENQSDAVESVVAAEKNGFFVFGDGRNKLHIVKPL